MIDSKNYNISKRLLSKLQKPFTLNAVPQPLKVNLLLSVFLVNLTVANKQSFSVKSFVGLLGQVFNS